MYDFITHPGPALALAVAAVVLALVAAYGLGRMHGSPVLTAYAGRPPVAEEAPPVAVPAVEIGMRVVARGDETRFMPDFHALPALVVEPDVTETVVAQQLVDENEELSAEVIELRDQVSWLESTKARALKRAAIDRARARVVFTDVLTRPRRTPKAQLSAEVIEIGSRRAPLVPPAIARAWEEASA